MTPSNEQRGAGRRGADRAGADTRSGSAPARGTMTRAEPPRAAGQRVAGQSRTGTRTSTGTRPPVNGARASATTTDAPPPPLANGTPAGTTNGNPPTTNGAPNKRAGTNQPNTNGAGQAAKQQRRTRANGADAAIGSTTGRRLPNARNGVAAAGPNGRSAAPVGPPRSGPDIANRLNPDAPAAEAPAGPTPSAAAKPGASSARRPRPPAAGDGPAQRAPRKERKAGEPERREDIDPISLTAELEPISDMVVQKRKVDATLARFSAVHDEMVAEEAERRTRRKRLRPWLAKDDDLEEALSSAGAPPTTLAKPVGDEDALDEHGDHEEHEAGAGEPPKTGRPGAGAAGARGPRDRWVAMGLKALAIAAAVAVLALTGIEWGTQTTDNHQIQEVAALDENSPAIANGAKQSGDENFLFVGTNARAGVANGDIRTDTVMVAHVPADHSRVQIVSFPGNLQVTRPVCQGWDNSTSQYTGTSEPAQDGVRLDAIYAIGGPRCVTDTVQGLSGLRINHFVGMDFPGFTSLGAALPPVSMCVKGPVRDSQLGTIVDKAGPVTLSGTQALNFVRADHVAGDPPGEYGKIARQQRFLAAVLRQVIGQNVLTSPSKLNNLLNVFSKATFGDNMDVSALLTLAQSLQGVSLNKITFITLPTTGTDNAQGEATSNSSEQTQLFNAIIDNTALPGTTATSTNSTGNSQVSASDTKIQVLNGGDSQQGIAGQTAESLKHQGFIVVEEGNAAHQVTQTVIRYAAADKARARLLASAVPNATLQEDDSADGAVELILGPNFDGKVVQASAGGSSGSNSTGTSSATLTTLNASDTSCA